MEWVWRARLPQLEGHLTIKCWCRLASPVPFLIGFSTTDDLQSHLHDAWSSSQSWSDSFRVVLVGGIDLLKPCPSHLIISTFLQRRPAIWFRRRKEAPVGRFSPLHYVCAYIIAETSRPFRKCYRLKSRTLIQRSSFLVCPTYPGQLTFGAMRLWDRIATLAVSHWLQMRAILMTTVSANSRASGVLGDAVAHGQPGPGWLPSHAAEVV